jgi:hypothetical protein
MRPRSAHRALALGAGAGVAYLVLAAVSGHLSPLDRRPLLDGFAPPAPYRWAKPPHNLASINKSPLSGRFTLAVKHGTVTEGLFATRDSQASVLLFAHAIKVPAGQTSVVLTLQPLAPPSNPTVPSREAITGNLYRILATLEPSRRPVRKLNKQATVTLVYPALAGPHRVRRLLASSDGVRFEEIPSIDSVAQEQVTGRVRSFGYYAVGVRGISIPPPPASSGGGTPVTLIVVVVAVAVLIGWLRWWERRRARSGDRGRHALGRRGRDSLRG